MEFHDALNARQNAPEFLKIILRKKCDHDLYAGLEGGVGRLPGSLQGGGPAGRSLGPRTVWRWAEEEDMNLNVIFSLILDTGHMTHDRFTMTVMNTFWST